VKKTPVILLVSPTFAMTRAAADFPLFAQLVTGNEWPALLAVDDSGRVVGVEVDLEAPALRDPYLVRGSHIDRITIDDIIDFEKKLIREDDVIKPKLFTEEQVAQRRRRRHETILVIAAIAKQAANVFTRVNTSSR